MQIRGQKKVFIYVIFFKSRTVTQKAYIRTHFEGEKTGVWKGCNFHKFSIKGMWGRGRGLLKDSILHKYRCCLGINLPGVWQSEHSFKESQQEAAQGKRTTEQTNRENIATSEFSCLTSQEISANSLNLNDCNPEEAFLHYDSLYTHAGTYAYMLLYSVWYTRYLF